MMADVGRTGSRTERTTMSMSARTYFVHVTVYDAGFADRSFVASVSVWLVTPVAADEQAIVKSCAAPAAIETKPGAIDSTPDNPLGDTFNGAPPSLTTRSANAPSV